MEQGMKKCPYCGEEIKAEAKKCRYCGEWLEVEAKQVMSSAESHLNSFSASSATESDVENDKSNALLTKSEMIKLYKDTFNVDFEIAKNFVNTHGMNETQRVINVAKSGEQRQVETVEAQPTQERKAETNNMKEERTTMYQGACALFFVLVVVGELVGVAHELGMGNNGIFEFRCRGRWAIAIEFVLNLCGKLPDYVGDVLSVLGICFLYIFLHRRLEILGKKMGMSISGLIFLTAVIPILAQLANFVTNENDVIIVTLFNIIFISLLAVYNCYVGIRLIFTPVNKFKYAGWLMLVSVMALCIVLLLNVGDAINGNEMSTWLIIIGAAFTIAIAYMIWSGCNITEDGTPFEKTTLLPRILLGLGLSCALILVTGSLGGSQATSESNNEENLETNTDSDSTDSAVIVENPNADDTAGDSSDESNDDFYDEATEPLGDYAGNSYCYNAYGDKFDLVKNGKLLVNLKTAYNDFNIDTNREVKVQMVRNVIFIIGYSGIGGKNVYSYDVNKNELATEATDCIDAKIKNKELGIKNKDGWSWYDIITNN